MQHTAAIPKLEGSVEPMGKWSTSDIKIALPLEKLSMKPSMALVGRILLHNDNVSQNKTSTPTCYDAFVLTDVL